MAHLVGTPAPDIVVSRDATGGTAMLFDLRTHERVEFSPDATAVLELAPVLRERTVKLARDFGLGVAAEQLELYVSLELGPGERQETERLVLGALADLAVASWFQENSER